jgi:2-C-methyl-D-erythritol 4-phosphate cytidylyltransferase
MSNAAIMLCAGRATRMRGTVADKVLAPLAGKPVLEYSLRAFLTANVVVHYVFVVRDAEQQAAIAAIAARAGVPAEIMSFAPGGAERQDSVLNGLRAAPPKAKGVFIHDCARPLVTPNALRALAAALKADRAAVLAHRVTDTIKQVPPRAGTKLRRLKLKDLNRETLWAMETPQAFARELIVKAYEKVRAKKARVTDDIAAAALLGHPATLVENPCPNPKLTHPEDFAWAELLLGRLG